MNFARAAAAGVVVAVASRIATAVALPSQLHWDGHFYAQLAQGLARTGRYADLGTGAPTAFYPVGYPFALSLGLRAGFGPFAAAVAVNVFATVLAVVAAAHLGARARLRTALATALYPGLVLWSSAAMGETLTAALLVTALALAVARRPAWAGVALGLAALVRPASLLAVALVPGAAPAGSRRGALVAAALAALCVVAPWGVRNARSLDAPALVSTNLGSNLLIGTRDDADGGYVPLRGERRCDDATGETARDRCFRDLAARRIAASPLRWLGLAVRKLARTVVPEHDPAGYVFGGRAVLATAVCTLAWWWLCARALRVARDGLRADPAVPAVAAMVAGIVVAHGVFLGADRYHLVLVPSLVALTGRRA